MKLWIRLDVDTPRDPRIGQLAESLSLPPRHTLGLLVAVWCAMGEHTQSGDLSKVSDTTLEEWAGSAGARALKPGQFAKHFSQIFLDEHRCDPHFRERQGKLVEKALKDRERMSRQRQNVPESFADSSRTNGVDAANSSTLRNGTQRDETEQHYPQQWGQGNRKTNGSQATKGAAMKVFAEIRAARVGGPTPAGGMRYHIPRPYIEALDQPAREAINGLGGAQVIASAEDDKLPILRSQFADLYRASL